MSGGILGIAGAAWPPRPAASAAVAVREAIVASPALGPLARRDGRAAAPGRPRGLRADRGRAPPARRRSGPSALLVAGFMVIGPGPGAVPGARRARAAARGRWRAAGRATGARSSAGCPQIATAVADALAGGRSVRAALASAASSVEGPAGGRAGAAARRSRARARRRRMRWARSRRGSARPRVDSFAAALLSQQLGGGDLAGLLRRFAASAAERDRVGGRRPLGDRAGPVHRAARRRDADRRGAVRRADPAGVRRRRCSPTGHRVALLAVAAAFQVVRLRRDPAAQPDRGRLSVPGGGPR